MNEQNWKIVLNLGNIYDYSPSYFINFLAKANIDGYISDELLEKELFIFYQGNTDLLEYKYDLILIRMKKILSINCFQLSTDYLFGLHKYLFEGIYDYAGKIRNVNIKRKEKCLDLNSVYYSSYDNILKNLNYDFEKESLNVYGNMPKISIAKNVISFITDVWQTHPFLDGNTRCISIFLIQYLQYLGIKVDLELFEKNFKYFRNALVRSNPTSGVNIIPTKEYLYKFLTMLIEDNNLKLNIEDTYISRKLF